MKKLMVIFLLFLFCSTISLHVQSDISFSIQKEEIKGEEWIRIFITNNNSEEILLFSSASWDHRGLAYLRDPGTFVQFVGNPNDSITKKTGSIILSKTALEKGLEKTSPFVIKAGETHTEVYKLFGETYSPIRTFMETYKSDLRELQAELTLNYLYGKEEGVKNKVILSNILEYDICDTN